MRNHLPALLLACALWCGCSDVATIGGLCPELGAIAGCRKQDHAADACAQAACADAAGPDACAGDDCDADAGSECVSGTLELEPMPLDVMLVVDDAASLAPWWPALNDGLRRFLQETNPTGIGVGLQRFDEVCEAQPYSVPLVPIAPLTENLSKLLELIPSVPLTSTSTVPALDGALQYARSHALAQRNSRVVLLLLTDVAPGACDGLVGDYAAAAQQLARAGYEGIPSIKTYVVGFGPMTAVGPVAQAGGTQARMIGVVPAENEVRDALESVRREAEPCAFRWPGPMPARTMQTVVATDGAMERSYPVWQSAAQCTLGDGFYIEGPAAAYPLVACPSTCASLTTTPGSSTTRMSARITCD